MTLTNFHPFWFDCRSEIEKDEEAREEERREATANGLHKRTAPTTEEGVCGKQVPDGKKAPRVGQGPQSERIADQDMVPEQESQNQEDERRQEPSGHEPYGAGTLQPRRKSGRR